MSYPAAFFERFHRDSPQVFFAYHTGQRRVLYASPAYERMLQGSCARATEELPGLLARIHPDDRDHAADCWQRWLAGRLLEPFELRLQGPDGCDQHLLVTPHREADADDVVVGGSVEDITATKIALWHADKYNSKKDTTLEILAHDLAAPFATLEQMSDYFQDSVAGLQNPQLTAMIEQMRTLCRDSVNLINDFVDHEFMDSVNVVLKRERVDLVEKLRLMLEQYQGAQQQLDKQFVFQVAQAPVYVKLDQNKFHQAINNLLSNALKFTPDGGTITVGVACTADQVHVRVADTGVGIPAPLQPGLFEKFTKARRPGLRGERSTGLGMSIIKTIVELHDGQISVQSAEGCGTTFVIALPLADADPA